jgi:ABC-type enterochelin transport system permease subunit
MKDEIKGFLLGIAINAVLYFINFWVNFALAKFIFVPIFGAYICNTLNSLFNTASFTTQMLPLVYAWTCLIGGVFFWHSWNND